MKKEFKKGSICIVVDYQKCCGSGECVNACPVNIFEIENGKAVAKNVDECIECCVCVNVCPQKAIEHSSCN
ncbi:MAG: 4Fe-4S binding protein [Candidatus Thermoplasmatota archaeon]